MTITLDRNYYDNDSIVIETVKPEGSEGIYIDRIEVDGKRHKGFMIDNDKFVNAKHIKFYLK